MNTFYVDKSAKLEELNTAYVLNEYFFNGNLYVGDRGKKIPDIQISELHIGIEVVQCEQCCDIIYQKLNKKWYDCGKNPDLIVKELRKNYKYGFDIVEKDEIKLLCRNVINIHEVGYFADYYMEILEKKFIKLNNDAYSDFDGEISLCIAQMYKPHSIDDIYGLIEKYNKIKFDFPKCYKKLYVVTLDCVYMIDNGIEDKFKIDFDKCKNNVKIEKSKTNFDLLLK